MQYTIPKLSNKDPNDWFIHFRYDHAGKRHSRKLRENLNRIKDLKERKRQFEILLEVRHEWLKAGWNPIMDPEFRKRNLIKKEDLSKMAFNAAMDFALEKKRADIAPKTYNDYNNVLEIVKEAAIISGMAFEEIGNIERFNIMDLLQQIHLKRKFSNRRFNFYMVTVRAMFSSLEKWGVVKYNVATKINEKPVAESNKFETYTEEEKIKIANCLVEKHPPLYVLFLTLYHTGIRPKELLLLQVKDFHLERRIIKIQPDLKKGNSKTKNIRNIPIANELLPYLVSMKLHLYPKEYYVFGSPFLPGKGNKGAKDGILGAMRSDFLTPSPFAARRNTITNLWKKLIWEGLEIHKYLYAGKHTGADDKILAGIELDALKNMYGHRSKYMTETYAKAIKEIHNSAIREKAPAFTAKVLRIA